ncbi:MAG: phosphate ABC transporter permease PstA [Rhodospirillaceae bacterium]|nr:phosphate ABC transporter permease PstA [Rhodospirillaceae bacterium]
MSAYLQNETLKPDTSVPMSQPRRRSSDIRARGEPFTWALGGALGVGCLMIVGFLLMVFWNGVNTFVPRPIAVVTLTDGTVTAGEATRSELYRVPDDAVAGLPEAARAEIAAADGFAARTLYRVGNYDLYNEDFRWVSAYEVSGEAFPPDMVLVERLEWGPFIGRVAAITVDGVTTRPVSVRDPAFVAAHAAARERWQRIREIERRDIGKINHRLEQDRLDLRRIELTEGRDSAAYAELAARQAAAAAPLQQQYAALSDQAQELRVVNERQTVTLAEIGGREKIVPLEEIVRIYPANDLGFGERVAIYLSRWAEFLTDEPREANTEGGVMPAIFGTFAMTLLMVVAVAPFGVITALYLREYATQGRLVSFVRISVNNLAGVPSIVYGVFGLGFFAYVLGGSIDQLFYPERLPNPTFGTGGLLWSSLTLALLTVPVVIVATEEALSAVPRSMREGSLACGASKWQTIKYIVLPRALPGIMTGIILAMARGAGEVAPLMLVGVVKLAPELPIDGFFPFVHLERSFMHLGFHIYDVGFQSRNSEAGKPMVFVTTLLLIGLIFAMNVTAIVVRNRLKKKFVGSQF